MSTPFAYLSQQDRERLRRLPFPVALPKMLPHEWTVRPLEVIEEPEDDETSCLVELVGPDSAQVMLTTTDGGIGDMLDLESTQELKSEVFGVVWVGTSTDADPPEFQSHWFPDQDDAECYHSFRARSLQDGILREFVASLDLFHGD